MKKCPFRKKYARGDYKTYGSSGVPLCDYVENFQDCIGEECMAYYTYSAKPYWDAQYEKDYVGCKLMKEEK